jgi:uncharacterized membrane protein
MAELSERDRQAILGDNWRAITTPAANDGLTLVERKLAAQKKSAVDLQFNAFAVLVIGLVLAGSSLYRDGASPYEHFFGVGVIVAGLAWLAYLQVMKARRA